MAKKRFYLKPFHLLNPNLFSICADLEFGDRSMKIEYSIVGPMNQLRLPPRSIKPARRDGLWESTCFEFFVGEKNSQHYWEFNFSPSLDWQAYSFLTYRDGRRDAEGIAVDLERYESATHLEICVKLGGHQIFEYPRRLEGSVAGVIETTESQKSYWAIEHRGPRADFHRRDSFTKLN